MKPRIPPVLVVVAAALLMWSSAAAAPRFVVRIVAGRPVAVALVIISLAIIAAALRLFRCADTTVHPLEPERATHLVVGGVYRVSRNPIYLGFALLLFAWGIWLSNLPAFPVVLVFVLYMTRFQIAPEEQALELRSGAEYHLYRQVVRRWL